MTIPIIIFIFIAHWYVSLFFQSFFNHRYAAHKMFTMTPFWEKVFYVLSWLTNGSSYLSPRIYAMMHRMHHAYADTEKDPHSPKFSSGLMDMMWKTRNIYLYMVLGTYPVPEKFKKNLPDWRAFDDFAESLWTRAVWAFVYLGIFIAVGTPWWCYPLLPVMIVMGPVHGAVINWFAHKIGYTNFEVDDTSKNILPLDILMMGEGYHNNHHKRGNNPNFGHRWHEIDPVYPFIVLFDFLGIIQLKNKSKRKRIFELKFSREEVDALKARFEKLQFNVPSVSMQEKFNQLVEKWDEFVQQDWKNDLSEYVKTLQARFEIQVFMENVSDSMRKKLASWVEPIDISFQEKMKDWDPKLKERLQAKLDATLKKVSEKRYFWETKTIFQAG